MTTKKGTKPVDVADTSQEFKTYWRTEAQLAIANFGRRRIEACYTPDRHAALEKVLSLIPSGASVGWGQSITLHQIGVISALKESGDHEIFDPWARDEAGNLKFTGADKLKVMRQAMLADVFLSGANAITLDGKVVATDGNGNRVAAMIFGPGRIIIVAGVNKLVPDLDAAFKRIRQVATPVNLISHALKYPMFESYYQMPCVKTGKCVDCTHVERACCYTIIIESGRASPRFAEEHERRHSIVLVGEALGI